VYSESDPILCMNVIVVLKSYKYKALKVNSSVRARVWGV